ncbi:hypothetical protein J6590_015528 [Homalodisca vitripennis]|nr:hypothetical protein J6590_015528 [Homalodisca vitripennis]
MLPMAQRKVQRLSQDNRIKQQRACLLLGWVTAEQSCPCKQPVCPPLVVVRKSPLSHWSPDLYLRRPSRSLHSERVLRMYLRLGVGNA